MWHRAQQPLHGRVGDAPPPRAPASAQPWGRRPLPGGRQERPDISQGAGGLQGSGALVSGQRTLRGSSFIFSQNAEGSLSSGTRAVHLSVRPRGCSDTHREPPQGLRDGTEVPKRSEGAEEDPGLEEGSGTEAGLALCDRRLCAERRDGYRRIPRFNPISCSKSPSPDTVTCRRAGGQGFNAGVSGEKTQLITRGERGFETERFSPVVLAARCHRNVSRREGEAGASESGEPKKCRPVRKLGQVSGGLCCGLRPPRTVRQHVCVARSPQVCGRLLQQQEEPHPPSERPRLCKPPPSLLLPRLAKFCLPWGWVRITPFLGPACPEAWLWT